MNPEVKILPVSSPVIQYDLVPPILLEQVAKRFELGLERYGRDNWRTGLSDPEFLQNRANHALAHLLAFIHQTPGEDSPMDNLAAVGWAVAVLLEAERLKLEKK